MIDVPNKKERQVSFSPHRPLADETIRFFMFTLEVTRIAFIE